MSKKLLLLGGSRYALPVIESAHKMDCKVITCDYLPGNIAHRHSDGYENINIVDKKAVLETASRLNVDGIMSFACDPGVTTAAYVAEKLGLPSCGSYESVSILQNKKKFRKLLVEHGFNVPKSDGFKSASEALKQITEFCFPVIVKSTDSAGSKGVTKVDEIKALKPAIEHALNNSIGKEFIIEEFLESKGHPSDSECFSINGDLQFVSYSSQRFDKKCGNPYTPAAFTWIPTISEKQQSYLTSELQRLLKILHMGTSIYNVESRESIDGKAYIMEVSPRGGGNRLAEMIRFSTGVDLIEYAVKAALGDPIGPLPVGHFDELWAEIILHSRYGGIFKELHIFDKLKKFVVETDLWVSKGDRIETFSGANRAIGTLVLRFEDKATMFEVMEKSSEYIMVETE